MFPFRIWEYLWENDVDVSGYQTPSELDDDHGDVSQAMQSDVGVSMTQFAAAGKAMQLGAWPSRRFRVGVTKRTMAPEAGVRMDLPRDAKGHVQQLGKRDALELFEEILKDKPDEQIAEDDELRKMDRMVDELRQASRTPRRRAGRRE